MVGIKYGGCNVAAELAGKSVAEARESYKGEFAIPNKAKAILNGKQIRKELEPRMMLNDNDKLSFRAGSGIRKPAVVLTCFLLALALTGGAFAYTYTTASATITATGDSDFAAIEPSDNISGFSTNVFGKHRGDIPTSDIFDITPDADYTGDMVVKVYLTNADELSKAYQYLNMKLQLNDSADANTANATGHTFQLLTLDNAVVTFDLQNPSGAGSPYHVYLNDGGYMTNSRGGVLDWSAGYSVSPFLYCEVTQR